MAFSKVILNGSTLIDLTQDTVAASNLLAGETAHGADGQPVVGAASGGGGLDVGKLLTKTLTSVSDDSVTFISSTRTFQDQTLLQSISFPNCKTISGASTFNGCTGLTNIDMPSLERFTAASVFTGCTSLTVVVLPSHNYATQNSIFSSCSNLTTYDCGHNTPTTTYDNKTFNQLFFDACTKLNTVILRASRVMTLGSVNNFRNTPFASGGSGGTIYVPSDLIASYKTATNWSTIDGYGTITWAAIEGSQYENYYADGTPIPTT